VGGFSGARSLGNLSLNLDFDVFWEASANEGNWNASDRPRGSRRGGGDRLTLESHFGHLVDRGGTFWKYALSLHVTETSCEEFEIVL
jgi:hypothetical protein